MKMIIKNVLLALVVIVILFVLTACSNRDRANIGTSDKTTHSVLLIEQYLIGVDDRVEVNVWKHPDLSITVPVRPDGKISVPLIGEVLAGGRSPVEVANVIRERLSLYIREPHVSVILVELVSHEFLSRVRVTGAVVKPLSLNFRQGMTVLDVVLEAGGLNEFASANRSKLFRKVDTKVKAIDIYLFDILEDGDMRTNIAVEPGDIVSIPERSF